MIRPHSRLVPAALGLVLALGGCYEGNELPAAPSADAAADALDMSDGFDASDDPVPDAGLDAALDPPGCVDDGECGGGWCAADGTCRPAVADLVFDRSMDGLLRVGGASFDLLPGYLEPWFDAAGPDCPDNRAGVFDGDLRTPLPEDGCLDGFDDLDGDGRFGAVWMAGGGLDRPARGIHPARPPAGRVVLFTRDEVAHLLVTLDVFAIDAARVAELADRVGRRLGISPEHVAIHVTGVRTGPDAVGLWGPSLSASGVPGAMALRDDLGGHKGLFGELPQQSGVGAEWWSALPGRIAGAARQAGTAAGPVAIRFVEGRLPLTSPRFTGAIELPDADGDGVRNDADDLAAWRTAPPPIAWDDHLPGAADPLIRLLAFDAVETGRPRVLLAGWSAAPASAPTEQALLDADHPGAVRALLEAQFNDATAVWLTGAAADTFRAGAGAKVVVELAEGGFEGPDGLPVEQPLDAAEAADPPAALAAMFVERLAPALAEAPRQPAQFELTRRYAWVPIHNPRIGLAARLGILPHLRDWLRGRVPTAGWVDGASAPGCGGLGCLRYRLDQLDLGPIALLTTPAALDRAYVDGRAEARLPLGDARNLDDLDLDGVPDAMDDEIRIQVRTGGAELSLTLPGPANPQRFPAIGGLGRTGTWVVGRTNGGIGSLRSRAEWINPFEGQLEPLVELARRDPERTLCGASHPCGGGDTLGELVDRLWQAQPAVLADLPGSRELRLVAPMDPRGPVAWRIEDADGGLRAEGDAMIIGPRDRAFTGDVDLVAAGVQPGDALLVFAGPAGSALAPVTVAEVVPIELRRHPNVGDAWRSLAPAGGDLVYNTACELIYAGPCPTRRPVVDDPNSGLPRTP